MPQWFEEIAIEIIILKDCLATLCTLQESAVHLGGESGYFFINSECHPKIIQREVSCRNVDHVVQ